MSDLDDDDYLSEDDEDYVPSGGELGSEEEDSGDDEDLSCLKEDGESADDKGKGKRKKKHSKSTLPVRKRQGGIKLEDGEENTEEVKEEEEAKKSLEKQIQQENEKKKEESEKKRADALWSSFLSDVKPVRPKSTVGQVGSGLGSLTSKASPTPNSKTSAAPKQVVSQDKVKITQVFDFAGESVEVTKEVAADSKEAKVLLSKEKEKDKEGEGTQAQTESTKQLPVPGIGAVKRPGGGLGGLLDKINKKPKMSTLEKSKLDWDKFKTEKGISEELEIHNRGKDGYLERKAFLERTDYRQFEKERDLRLSTSKR